MINFTIRLSEVTKKSIDDNAKKEGVSPSDYVRKMIDLGMKVAEYESKKNENLEAKNKQKELKDRINKAIIETMLLSRVFIRTFEKLSPEEAKDTIDQATQKAEEVINYYSQFEEN